MQPIIIVVLVAIGGRVAYGLVKGVQTLRKEKLFAKHWTPEQIPFSKLKNSVKENILEVHNIVTLEQRIIFENQMAIRSLEVNNLDYKQVFEDRLDSGFYSDNHEFELSDRTREKLRKLFDGENEKKES